MPNTPYPIITWQRPDRLLRLAVATSWRQRMQGLAHTRRTDWHGIDGMLLRFPWPMRWPIWMRGMQFPITAHWLRHGHVITTQHLPTHPTHRLYFPTMPADAVIEVMGA